MKQFILLTAMAIALAGGSDTVPTYEEVRDAAKAILTKVELTKDEKPAYEIKDNDLRYYGPKLPSLWDKDSESVDLTAALVQVKLAIDLFRQYPPTKAKKNLVSGYASNMDEILKTTIKDLQRKTKKKDRLARIANAQGQIRNLIQDAGREQAKDLNLKYIKVIQTTNKKITVSTKPADGKVYMISDMQKTLIEIRKLKLKAEILKCAISGNTTFLEGKVWYYIEWANKTTGPVSTIITSDTLVLE